MGLTYLFQQAIITVKLKYFQIAISHLMQKDPCHADIPEIVHKINDLERRKTFSFIF